MLTQFKECSIIRLKFKTIRLQIDKYIKFEFKLEIITKGGYNNKLLCLVIQVIMITIAVELTDRSINDT